VSGGLSLSCVTDATPSQFCFCASAVFFFLFRLSVLPVGDANPDTDPEGSRLLDLLSVPPFDPNPLLETLGGCFDDEATSTDDSRDADDEPKGDGASSVRC